MSAYLTLPEDIERSEPDKDRAAVGKRRVSSGDLGSFVRTHSRPAGDVRWTLIVASRDGAPLKVRDDASGNSGDFIILSPPLEADGALPGGAGSVRVRL